jgi:hypothetical protein
VNRNVLALAGVTLSLLATSCKEGPTAGEFAVNLTTPNSDDGAIQWTASATEPATITSVGSSCSGCKLFVVKVSDNQYRGVLTGPISAGTLFRIGASDTKGKYAVTVNVVANRGYTTRSSTDGYSIALVP